MDKTETDSHDQDSGNMLNQKTNEDYNKEKPNPNARDFKLLNGKNMGNGDQGTPDKKIIKIKNKNGEAMKTYTCSMHPEVRSDKPGKCSKCGMELMEKK